MPALHLARKLNLVKLWASLQERLWASLEQALRQPHHSNLRPLVCTKETLRATLWMAARQPRRKIKLSNIITSSFNHVSPFVSPLVSFINWFWTLKSHDYLCSACSGACRHPTGKRVGPCLNCTDIFFPVLDAGCRSL